MRNSNIKPRLGRFEDHLHKLDSLIEWMSRLGVPIKNSRIAAYQRTLREMLQVIEAKNYEIADERLTEFAETLYEIHELNHIFDGFSDAKSDPKLVDALTQIVGGPLAAKTEGGASNRSRNTVFELIVASKLRQGGADARVAYPADIYCKLPSGSIFFECKRPQTLGSIDRNLKKANKQLGKEGRLRGSTRSFGVVAVDLTKAFAAQCESLYYSDISEVDELTSKASYYLGGFIQQESSVRFDRRVLGVLGRISVVAIPRNSGDKIAYWQQFVFNRFTTCTRSAKPVSDELGCVLERSRECSE